MTSRLSWVLALALVLATGPARAQPIALEVDAREAPRGLVRARLTIPAAPGPLVLAYPKWLPGHHAPSGPIADLVDLRLRANGKPLAWRRDDTDMFAFHVDVPAGARAVEIELAYAPSEGKRSTRLWLVRWHDTLLYPRGTSSDDVTYAAELIVPDGWGHGTALRERRRGRGRVAFAPVSLTTLVDSPVLIGRHVRELALRTAPVARIVAAADSEAALAADARFIDGYRRLVAEAEALFGNRRYETYTFLVALSDHLRGGGLEHHESSDNRLPERTLIDEDLHRARAYLLPHEIVHSWNGKYRRPAGLAIARFDEPMRGELLWVYEGLTNYLGEVLTARSGLWTAEEYRASLALDAAEMDHQIGRAWRPLRDTTVAAQVLGDAGDAWEARRRGLDYYAEGSLIWLEVDALIRQLSRGQRSLDDFCQRFHGGASGPPMVRGFERDDVLAALDEVAPHDWRGFFAARVDTASPRAPLAGLAASGWRLVYRDQPTSYQRAREAYHDYVNERFSIGITVEKDGVVSDVVPGLAADKAGLAPGATLVAVDGRRYSPAVLRDALRGTRTRRRLELLVEKGDYFATLTLAYAGGARYPILERDPARPDLLTPIIAPRIQAVK